VAPGRRASEGRARRIGPRDTQRATIGSESILEPHLDRKRKTRSLSGRAASRRTPPISRVIADAIPIICWLRFDLTKLRCTSGTWPDNFRQGTFRRGSIVSPVVGRSEIFGARHRCRGRPFCRLAQYIATAPHGLDLVTAAGRLGELLAQLANENVSDLGLRLFHSLVEVVENPFLCHGGALAQANKLKDAVFLWGQVNRLVVDRDDAGIEIDGQLAVWIVDSEWPGTADDRQNARGQFPTFEGLRF
jgi:hypothetical protein